jgi:hypothetical protein
VARAGMVWRTIQVKPSQKSVPPTVRYPRRVPTLLVSPVNLPECVLISVTFLAKISMTFTKCHGHFWRNKIILISVINTGIFKNFESKISGILFH